MALPQTGHGVGWAEVLMAERQTGVERVERGLQMEASGVRGTRF